MREREKERENESEKERENESEKASEREGVYHTWIFNSDPFLPTLCLLWRALWCVL